MKRLFFAAAVVGAAVLPATAGAVPPGTSGGPMGSAACMVFGGGPGMTPSCNFTGASGGLGYIGGSSGGFTLTHVAKVVHCGGDGKVDGFAAQTVSDASGGAGPFNAGPSYPYAVGRVYTFTILGQGWGAAGGPSTPGPNVPSEPATPSAANNYAGAQDSTGGKVVGDAC